MKGAKVEVQEGYPQLVWHSSGNISAAKNSSNSNSNSNNTLTSSEAKSAEDQVMHYIVKVDR